MAVDAFVELDDLKAFLGVTTAATDDLLTAVNTTAAQALVDVMNGDPRLTSVVEFYSGGSSNLIVVNNAPIVAVTDVTLIFQRAPAQQRTLDQDDFFWDDNAVYWRSGLFPRGQRNVRVSYSGGLGDDSISAIQQAAMFTAKAIWESQNSSMNVSSESFGGVISQSYWATGPGAVPPQARMLVTNYIRRFKTL